MIIPSIAPIVMAVAVVLLQFAIKTFDLVVALTNGGPGISTTFPANYVYDLMFQRGQIAIGAAAAMMMLAALAVVLVPYSLWLVWRRAGSPAMVDATFEAAMIRRRTRARPAAFAEAHRRLRLSRLLRVHLSPAAVRRRRQFVPRIAGDHPERLDRLPAQLLLQSLA